ncbi:MAG: transposase [Anaerolineaceae bacterium]|nr:transposase [Anaerolineaceae bacterium]
MLTRILHNSDQLHSFFNELGLDLSVPQRQHMLNMADALLVCEDSKTLAALQRQFVQAPDASNMADFLRISPWQAPDVRAALRSYQVNRLLAGVAQSDTPPVIYLNIDDSLGEKDKATRHIQAVDWHHDHSESTKSKPRYKNAFCYLVCTLRVGQQTATVDLRLYLRQKTVRRLNRKREKSQRLRFRSKYRLARTILEQLRPLLPTGWKVVVQFDSWYASANLIKYCRRQRWQVTCGLKCNRRLSDKRLDQHAQELRHKWYTKVCVTTTDGDKSTYFVRRQNGRLANVPHDVRVFFSKRHPRAKALSYFMSTDFSCSTRQVLQGYSWRWSCEVVNFYAKTQLGLADFRVRAYQAVDRYMVVVHLAWAYVEQRFDRDRSSQIQTYGDIIRQHRDEHAVDWLTGAVEMAIETGDVDLVLQRFLRLDSQPA